MYECILVVFAKTGYGGHGNIDSKKYSTEIKIIILFQL